MEIYPLTPEACDQIARLHMLYLPTPFSGKAGHRLLYAYYSTICAHKGASGFMALDDETLVGFICGIWNANELRSNLLRTRGLSLAWWGACHMLAKPSLINNFANRFRTGRRLSISPEKNDQHQQLELRPIVVAPIARGSGLALQLVKRLIRDARDRGFQSIHLYTEPDNIPAQRLYAKAGFQKIVHGSSSSNEYLYFRLDTLSGENKQ